MTRRCVHAPPEEWMSEPAPDLFASTARYYARYRPGYPETFFRHVVARFGLDGTGCVLDLGCGTGQLAIPLAWHAREVIGMDPEPEMLAEAAAAANRAGVHNIRWIRGSDRDLERLRHSLGTPRVATMGRSFHWMDRDATLRTLATMLEPAGGVVVVSDDERVWGVDGWWQETVRETIIRWLGPVRRAGSGTRTVFERFEDVFARSPFPNIEIYHELMHRTVTTDELIGYLYSTSFCSPAVLGDNRAAFEADLRARLHALSPTGVFDEDVALDAWLLTR
jgi:ubiquinone/menaquinone biosynthesis C-methylase UbiE